MDFLNDKQATGQTHELHLWTLYKALKECTPYGVQLKSTRNEDCNL